MSAPPAGTGLTAGGMAFMALAWAVIAGLAVYCFVRISRGGNRRR
ncbi:MAG: hypothetical protein ACE5JH_08680 [Acidobacteriota bacterium]